MTVSDLTERELIARIQSHLPASPDWIAVGIGDDAAVVKPERNRLEVLTVDALVEDVHFNRRFTPPAAIGHRALAVNLSDLAAMGATPRLALLSMVLPATLALDDFEGIVKGFAATASRYRVHVAGGNLTRSPGPLIVDVTVTGTVKPRRTLTRSGARSGDDIYVSGSLGLGAAGLDVLRTRNGASGTEPCVDRYLYPEPRLRLGSLLARNRAATACMDLSDGLADGLAQVARESGVGMLVDTSLVPIDPAASAWFGGRGKDPLDEVLTAGDDYELLFTARPRSGGRLEPARRHGLAAITRIGVCTGDGRVLLQRPINGTVSEMPLPAGFSHFR
jgi:thiamine-monophosphate kinase